MILVNGFQQSFDGSLLFTHLGQQIKYVQNILENHGKSLAGYESYCTTFLLYMLKKN